MTEGLRIEVADHVARLTVDRPEVRNALSAEIVQAMADFLERIEQDPEVRVVLITGGGDHFMAGGDVKNFSQVIEAPVAEVQASFRQRSVAAARLWLTLDRIPQPVVCMVRGSAAGAALSFVAGADLTICADNAVFVLAHVGIGLVADAATSYHLPRAIGLRKAKEMALLGEKMDAQQALAAGLVNRVVPLAELEAETEKLVCKLARGPAVSLAQSKRIMNASLANDMAAQIDLETDALGICGGSEDLREGVRAFVEKRRPDFKGK